MNRRLMSRDSRRSDGAFDTVAMVYDEVTEGELSKPLLASSSVTTKLEPTVSTQQSAHDNKHKYERLDYTNQSQARWR
jgi:hypothetical protein